MSTLKLVGHVSGTSLRSTEMSMAPTDVCHCMISFFPVAKRR